MATPWFQTEITVAKIKGGAACALEDSSIGTQVAQFQDRGFKSFSDEGVNLFTHNSLKRDDIPQVVKDLVNDPTWAFVQGLGAKIPPGYAYRFYHGGPARIGVMVYLCSPQIHVTFYHGSQTRKTEIDKEMSKSWGVLMTPEAIMVRDGISKEPIQLKEGGLILADCALAFTINQGWLIGIGIIEKVRAERLQVMGFDEKFRVIFTDLEKQSGISINFK